jgi:uncharacterized cofD-like protein
LTERGPAVVAIGGGHGLATTITAARGYAGRLTAVVSVAHDGGSSGRLRVIADRPAPGDLRRCLVAMAGGQSLWARTLEHRFEKGELAGHAVGNLLLTGMSEVAGDFTAAVDEVSRVLGLDDDHRVLPATSGPVVLQAEATDGRVEGQVAVSKASGVRRVSLRPPEPASPPAVVDAILAADQVVIGPGSLYTSVLAASIVPAVHDALARTGARRVYVANLRPQIPETEGYDVADHAAALARHGVPVDVVLYDPDALPAGALTVPAVACRVGRANRAAHDPAALGAALARLL